MALEVGGLLLGLPGDCRSCLRRGGIHQERDIDQVMVVIDEDLLHLLGRGLFGRWIIGLDLVPLLECADRLLPIRRGYWRIGAEGLAASFKEAFGFVGELAKEFATKLADQPSSRL